MKLSAELIADIASKIELTGIYTPKQFAETFEGTEFDSNLSDTGFRRIVGDLNDEDGPAQFAIYHEGQIGTVTI